MRLEPVEQRFQHPAGRPHLVGRGGQADLHAFPGEAFALAVQRLVLAELLEQQRGQQVRPRPAARRGVERCRRLADRLAVPAGEFLTHRLDDRPPRGNALGRLGDAFAQLAQPGRATAWARRRRRDHDALARQVRRERLARRRFAGDAGRAGRLGHLFRRQVVLADTCLRLLQLEFELVEQSGGPFGAPAVEVALELLDPELQAGNQRLVAGSFGPRLGGVRLRQRSPATRFDQRGAQGVDGVGKGVHGAGLYLETRTDPRSSCRRAAG